MSQQTVNTTAADPKVVTDPAPALTVSPPDETAQPRPKRNFWEAFKNFAIIFSFIVNFVLVLVLLLSPLPLFTVKAKIAEPLLVKLDGAFAALGDTTIQTTVNIQDTMPVVFDLPLAQNTDVILTAPVPLQAPATFFLPGGGGAINGTVSLNLPQYMALPVSLNMMVPVSTTVPVIMEVPVEIHLAEAGMGPAIQGLRDVFNPITSFLQSLPNSLLEIFRPQAKTAQP
ncbi:MAG TPA: hypothetical protein PKH77_04105 [Anaerolineae bacterium]|nr:hypothetical protein [Anaerolineae bacterium]